MHNSEHQFEPIAVVGVGAMFPGRGTTAGFWQDLVEGRNLITDVPESHWRVSDHFDPDPSKPDRTYSQHGAFIPHFPFDSVEYGTPPNVVETTDTVQLMALVVAKQLITEITKFADLDKARTSVVLGVAAGTELIGDMASRLNRPIWIKAMTEGGVQPEVADRIADNISAHFTDWRESTFPGLLGNVVSGRIANRLDLNGTNFTADAACASSLAAVKFGMHELWLGDADLVLTGGADALNNIFMYMCFSKTPAMSASGVCRPFSHDADGTLMGEGCGLVALRRLSDAERDGNTIYGVIRGIGSSSDGNGTSVYAPRAGGQSLALERAYEMAGYAPRTVGLVEAHGTGTRAGDAAEFAGLRAVFAADAQDDQNWCALGSVKSQIGHTKSAAGAAGMIKALFALHHKVLPPTINVSKPNDKLGIDESPFYLNTQARPWIKPDNETRRASVSAFGFGGSNFHITMEEYRGPGRRAARLRAVPAELFLLSAPDLSTLRDKAALLLGSIERTEDLGHHAMESAAGFRRDDGLRLSVVVGSLTELRSRIEQALQVTEQPTRLMAPGVAVETGIAAAGRVACLFAGQGSQYIGMSGDLALHFDWAHDIWAHVNRLTEGRGDTLTDLVFPPPAFGSESEAAAADRLTATQNAQPAIAGVSLVHLKLLEILGIKPDFVAGHSFGEVMALHAAGVVDMDAAVRIAVARGEAMASAARDGESGMIAVNAGADAIVQILEAAGSQLAIANDNAPDQVILSGTGAALRTIIPLLETRGLQIVRLPVSTAFHSPIVATAAQSLAEALRTHTVSAPSIPVYANTTACPYPADGDQIRSILSQQMAQSVRFRETIESLYSDGARTFIEVGPGSVLTGLVKRNLGNRPHRAVSLDSSRGDAFRAMLHTVGQLAISGYPVDLDWLWQAAPPAVPVPAPPKHALWLNGANYKKPYPPVSAVDGRPASTEPIDPRREAGENEPAASVAKPVEPPAVEPVTDEPVNVPPVPVAQPAPSIQEPPVHPLQAAPTAETTETVRAIVAEKTGYPPEMLGLDMDLEAELGIDSIKQVEILSALREQLPAMPEIAPERLAELRTLGLIAGAIGGGRPRDPEPTAMQRQPAPESEPVAVPMPPAETSPMAATASGVTETVRAIVAEKTGYPPEMLGLDMDLEAELGIDSIKQVEILSALREQLPAMPEIAPERLAELRTLGLIADAIGGVQPVIPEPAYAQPRAVLEPEAAVAPMPTAEPPPVAVMASAVTETVRAIVAEKTGYPPEMLGLDMDLEAELGIDSIKQVEILSALREQLPSMPEIAPERLADLRTLGLIANAIGGDRPHAPEPTAAQRQPAPEPEPVAVPMPPAETPPMAVMASDVTETVRAIVAEKTGYPPEMLGLDMDLEAELGIDSIKQVEILSALREQLPSMPEIAPERLADLRTLGLIATAIAGSATTAAVADPLPATDADPALTLKTFAATLPGDISHILRQRVELQPSPAIGKAPRWLDRDCLVGVTDCAPELAESLVDELNSRSVRAKIIAQNVPDDIRVVVVTGGLATGLASHEIHLRALQAARSAAPRLARTASGFVTLQDTGGRFGRSLTDLERACSGGLTGLTKTVSQEWPDTACKAIDVERGDASREILSRRIVDEILQGGDDIEVGLTAEGERLVPVCTIAATRPMAPRATVSDGDLIVVTGGGRGITAQVVMDLASQARLRFAVVGRTTLVPWPDGIAPSASESELRNALARQALARGEQPSPREIAAKAKGIIASREIVETLEAIRETGSEADYWNADVTNYQEIANRIRVARERWGPVAGVIHGAGVRADKMIEQKTDEQFMAVFQTKIAGLLALMFACGQDPLKFIFLFSSVSGRFGNAGQADYAMANESLNRAAWALHNARPDCHVASINWGPWDGGMVDDQMRALFDARGVPVIPMEAGVAAFRQELLHQPDPHPEIIIAGRPQRETVAAE